MNERLNAAKRAFNEAVTRMNAAADAVAELASDAADDVVEAAQSEFDTAEAEVVRSKGEVERVERIFRAREQHTPLTIDEDGSEEQRSRASAGTVVVRESLTYQKEDRSRSFFADLFRAQTLGDSQARQRLAMNAREVAVEIQEKRKITPYGGGVDLRDLTSTDGAGGDFVPPVWITDDWVTVARAARVLADRVRHMDLPAYGDSINVPKLATGTAVATQTDNSAVQETDATTSAVTATVKSLAGQQDLSRQSLERSAPGLDTAILQDLVADYAAKLDAAVATAVIAASGIVAVSYTDASPTLPELYPKIADAIQQIATNRHLPAECIVMHPRRWGWITAALDSTNRPFVTPVAGAAYNPLGQQDMVSMADGGPVGFLMGLPVYLDANITITNGASTNEDVILVGRFSDDWLYEDPAGPRQFTFEGVGSGTATIRLQVFGYYAFTALRYAKANAAITGTGLVTPTF